MERGNLELRLLGLPAARRDGTPLPLRTKKALALLAYLAAEGGTHRRAELAALLWPESDEKRARTTLRSALADLRGALGSDGEYLLVDRDSLGLGTASGLDLDLTVLRNAYDLARDWMGLASTDGEERRELVERLRNGLEACRGEFLEDFYLDDAPEFDYWSSVEREGWRARLAVVLDSLSALLLESGEAREATAVAERWTAQDPLSEAAHERLMRALYALGDWTGALRVYEQYRFSAEGGPEKTANAPEMAALAARISAERGDGGTLSRLPPDRRPEQAYGSRGYREASSVPLVGRAEELGVLAREHGLVPSQGVRAVALVGEAGIGKTRLAEEFLLWSAAEGADVLRGYYTEVGEGVPYRGVISVLRPRLERERAPDDLLEDVWLSELGRILPELQERYPDLPLPAADEATAGSRLFEAVVRLFEALARRAQVTLFMDDLHWADAAALNRLRYVVRRLAEDGYPVLLVVAMREEEMDRVVDLWGWLSSLERVMPVRRLKLGSLNVEDTLRVLRSITGGEREDPGHGLKEFGRRLHAETGGQPFFLLETIRALLDRGTLNVKSDVGEGATGVAYAQGTLEGLLPPGVRGLIRERLSRLGSAASDLLAAGAVLGDGFEFELVRRVASLGENEGLTALDEALRGRILCESRLWLWRGGEYGGYSFVHDKIRDVVYTDAGEARRRVFHRRALEALEEEGAPAAELARHALAARTKEAAFRHSVAAAEEAFAVFAVEDARTHFGRARSLLEGETSGGGTR
jgi:DNA-binding SARP family transcriptional activator